MRNHFPIYNLLHQEIKACANHLLELSQSKELSVQKDVEHILGRLMELHQFAIKVRSDEHYHPLTDLKYYLENTMLRFQDDQDRLQSMRLSEAISLLGQPAEMDRDFKPSIVKSLTAFFFEHFVENCKPGRPLFKKLAEIKREL